jgi:hypothetical protein
MLMATVIVAVAELSFIQGLVTAVCSAVISGSFLLASVHVSSRRTDAKVEKAKTEILEGQEAARDALASKERQERG